MIAMKKQNSAGRAELPAVSSARTSVAGVNPSLSQKRFANPAKSVRDSAQQPPVHAEPCPMSNAEKIEQARQWMRQQGISLDTRKWRGPAVPVENLAGRQPVLSGYDCGMLGQIRQIVRMFQ